MIMDCSDTSTQVALENVCFSSFDTLVEDNVAKSVAESKEDCLNTPVTSCTELSFFGPDTLDPPPITTTGRVISYIFIMYLVVLLLLFIP